MSDRPSIPLAECDERGGHRFQGGQSIDHREIEDLRSDVNWDLVKAKPHVLAEHLLRTTAEARDLRSRQAQLSSIIQAMDWWDAHRSREIEAFQLRDAIVSGKLSIDGEVVEGDPPVFWLRLGKGLPDGACRDEMCWPFPHEIHIFQLDYGHNDGTIVGSLAVAIQPSGKIDNVDGIRVEDRFECMVLCGPFRYGFEFSIRDDLSIESIAHPQEVQIGSKLIGWDEFCETLYRKPKRKVIDEYCHGPAHRSIQALEFITRRNLMAVEVTEPVHKREIKRAKKEGRRKPRHRRYFTMLTPQSLIQKRVKSPDNDDPLTQIAPHWRRGHWRTYRSARYKHVRGRAQWIEAVWIGPTEVIDDRGKLYKVRLDL